MNGGGITVEVFGVGSFLDEELEDWEVSAGSCEVDSLLVISFLDGVEEVGKGVEGVLLLEVGEVGVEVGEGVGGDVREVLLDLLLLLLEVGLTHG